MSESEQEQKPGTVLMLPKGSILSARVRKTKNPGTRSSEFVKVELLDNLYLNYVKRIHPFLDNCRCRIPVLEVEARSVNHAYTLISTEYEVDRLAKGGNVFNNVYYPNYSGDLMPLASLRASTLAALPKTAIANTPQVKETDLSAIAHILNDVLYDESLFVKLIHKSIETCDRATGSKSLGTKRKAGDFFPFYRHVFVRFTDSLRSMDISHLMQRWSNRLDLFLHGMWSGYFLNEIDYLVTHDSDFAQMVMEASDLRLGDAGILRLEVWCGNKPDL